MLGACRRDATVSGRGRADIGGIDHNLDTRVPALQSVEHRLLAGSRDHETPDEECSRPLHRGSAVTPFADQYSTECVHFPLHEHGKNGPGGECSEAPNSWLTSSSSWLSRRGAWGIAADVHLDCVGQANSGGRRKAYPQPARTTSVVVGLVDADRAALPVAGRLDPGLVEPAVVDEVATQELRGLRFARGPGSSLRRYAGSFSARTTSSSGAGSSARDSGRCTQTVLTSAWLSNSCSSSEPARAAMTIAFVSRTALSPNAGLSRAKQSRRQ